MSPISIILIILGIAATALFFAGFVRGLKQSIADRDATGDHAPHPERAYWPVIVFSVISSAAIIAAAGVTPYAVYVGPFLVILTAAANGAAFFLDNDRE